MISADFSMELIISALILLEFGANHQSFEHSSNNKERKKRKREALAQRLRVGCVTRQSMLVGWQQVHEI